MVNFRINTVRCSNDFSRKRSKRISRGRAQHNRPPCHRSVTGVNSGPSSMGTPTFLFWLILQQIPSMLLYLQSLQAADMKKIIKARLLYLLPSPGHEPLAPYCLGFINCTPGPHTHKVAKPGNIAICSV